MPSSWSTQKVRPFRLISSGGDPTSALARDKIVWQVGSFSLSRSLPLRRALALFAELCFEQADDRGQDRDDQDQDDDQLEMLLDCGDAAEEIAQEGEEGGPYQASQDTEGGEASPAHSGDARYEGHEGPDEREEASQDHGQGAPLVDQALGLGDSFGGQ